MLQSRFAMCGRASGLKKEEWEGKRIPFKENVDKDRDGAGGLYVRMGIYKAKKRCGRNEGGREVGGDERRS